MRKKAVVAAVLSAMILVLSFMPSSGGFAQHNDAKYDSYKNMIQVSTEHARYIVPNLYRQDASYKNVKRFPLIINGGTAYVPMDIFSMFSYIETVNSSLAYGFYINNTKNGKYVAFNLENNTAATHANANSDIAPKMFYSTYYLPAKAMCETLGLKFEIYDNSESGIVAVRISDEKAKYTFNELIKAYSPTKLEPSGVPEPVVPDSGNSVSPPQNGSTVPNTPDSENSGAESGGMSNTPANNQTDTTVPPEDNNPQDIYAGISARNIYVMFENCTNNAVTLNVLNVLKKHGVKAGFFMTGEQILENPDTIRRIYADNHTVGLYILPEDADGKIYSNEEILNLIEKENSAMYLVSKQKTRLVKIADGFQKELENDGFVEYAANAGYNLYGIPVSAGDSGKGKAAAIFAGIQKKVIENEPKRAKTVHIRFGTYGVTAQTLEMLLAFIEKYPQFTAGQFDAYTAFPAFR